MTKAHSTEVLEHVDARKRVSLGNLAERARYLARSMPNGTIVFERAEVVTVVLPLPESHTSRRAQFREGLQARIERAQQLLQ
jgi:hypothetical protein